MVSRHTEVGHTATSTPSSSSSTSSTSSIKPTGWIRSNSASRPVLGDRTNLPSSSKGTPLRSLPKPTVQSAGRRSTPATSGNAGKQQKLSSFFAPNTAPPAAAKAVAAAGSKARLDAFQYSPSIVRARSRSTHVENEGGTPAATAAAALEDDELEARAASLLRGRFGSVTRSLNPTRSNTPNRLPSPPRPTSDPESPRSQPTSATHLTMPPPLVLQNHRPRSPQTRITLNQTTPPRPARHAPQDTPSSPPPFEPTFMQESLSNFTPLPWEKAHSSRMALFQRLAGKSKEEILEIEKSHMADEIARAHARMQPRSPAVPSHKTGSIDGQRLTPPSKKGKLKQAAALAGSPPKSGAARRMEAVLRSPRTNRRIYALETQLGGGVLGGGGRAVSPQPMSAEILCNGSTSTKAAEQRRSASEVRYYAAAQPASRQGLISNEVAAQEAEPSEVEEESETMPLPWPAEDGQQEVEADAAADQGDETQPLPWYGEEDEQPIDRPPDQIDAGPEQSLAEVPPSDDEDLLLQAVVPSSSSSSSSPSPSSSPSDVRSKRHTVQRGLSPTSKRQRIKQDAADHLATSPTLSRRSRGSIGQTPLQQRQLPRVSPITLTPHFGGGGGGGENRFDRVVAALRREERRQHNGMQLNLNSFLSSAPNNSLAKSQVEAEKNRKGLSEDLQDILSDDDDNDGDDDLPGGDATITTHPLQFAAPDDETDDTQPLAWPSTPTRRPQIFPVRPQHSSPLPPTQRSAVSTTSTSTSTPSSGSESGIISLPSESNLDEAGNTQLRLFFQDL